MYYSPWYANFGQIFDFAETHPNVSWGSEEHTVKILAKDIASY